MKRPTIIYPAAALFNLRELYFNSVLVEKLEEKGYETRFPQRDGFEFSNIAKLLSKKLSPKETDLALKDMIYFLDMGRLLLQSDVVLANFDEPIDEGVVVEAQHARYMNKFVLGFRTESRSPYGTLDDSMNGMHWFPTYQCDKFLFRTGIFSSPEEREKHLDAFVDKVDEVIKTTKRKPANYSNPKVKEIKHSADLLFSGIDDIQSKAGLEEVTSRYFKHRKEFLRPEIIR